MGHPIHKHMSSGQRYDDKQAYNKDLSDSARLHYLENEEHDKGMSRKGNAGDHMMTIDAYKRHTEANSNTTQHHSQGMSRYGSDYGDSAAEFNKGLRDASAKGKLDSNPKFKAMVDAAPSRKSSPANYETAKQERMNLNTENPIKKASCKYKK